MVELVDLNTQKTEDNADDVFAKAFNMISEADAKADEGAKGAADGPVGGVQKTEEELKAEADAQAAKAAADAAEAAKGATGSTLPPDDKEQAAAAAAEAAKAAAQATPEMSDDELARRLASMIKKVEPAPEPVADTRATAQPEPDPTAGMYTKEQLDFLTKYAEEYPDIAQAEFMRRRAEYAQLVQFVFTSVSKELRPRLEALEGLLSRTHLGDIQSAVPDYNDNREQVIAWVAKQPDYVRAAYEQVVKRGTVEQVADLIKRYKSETGASATQTQDDPASKAAKAAADVKEAQAAAAIAKAAKSLAPVANKGTRATPTAISPTDFDAAFAMFKDTV